MPLEANWQTGLEPLFEEYRQERVRYVELLREAVQRDEVHVIVDECVELQPHLAEAVRLVQERALAIVNAHPVLRKVNTAVEKLAAPYLHTEEYGDLRPEHPLVICEVMKEITWRYTYEDEQGSSGVTGITLNMVTNVFSWTDRVLPSEAARSLDEDTAIQGFARDLSNLPEHRRKR